MNKALRAAIAQAKTYTVSHNGLEASLTPPTGEEAVEYVSNARELIPSKKTQDWQRANPGDKDNPPPAPPEDIKRELNRIEEGSMKFVAKWFPILLEKEDDEELTPQDAWRAFLALGGIDGPVMSTMIEMVSGCLGLPQEKIEQVPS